MSLTVKPTWREINGYSRYKTVKYNLSLLENWKKQKRYCYNTVTMCIKFAKHNCYSGSVSSMIILAGQNFKLYREFVNKNVNDNKIE